MNDEKKVRLLELLADQTVFGLTEAELLELKQLKLQFPDWEKYDSLEAAAAAIGLSNLDTAKEMPASLRTKILTDADNYFDSLSESQNVFNFASKNPVDSATASVTESSYFEPKRPFWQWLGWAVAATACVALAINLWTTRNQPQPEIAGNPPPVQTPLPKLSAAQEREQFLAKAPDVIQTTVAEANPKAPKNISGDIVWSNSEQKGYMRFRGFPVNDPNKETYQLWIVDETQNPKTPINGGVFDVNENGEVIIPINAEIKVKKPKAFAITKEKPGGVVVSRQEEVMAIAKI